MVTLLSKLWIKPGMSEAKQREAYGMLCSVLGIALNVLLFIGKMIAGLLSKSIAITADAFNNLSDAASSIITLVGFKLAGAKPDRAHPFGHGRMEYLSGLAVAALILIMGFELIKDSIDKILHPSDTDFSVLILMILLVSIAVKLYMAFYNNSVGKKIGSATIRAVATDSLSDSIMTAVVIVASLIQYFFGLHVDGICGVVVGFMVLKAGVSAAKELIDPLLGVPPTKEFVEQVEDIVLHFDPENIVGLHDMIVHDYGPGRRFITLHAEVPAEGDISVLHDIIDNLEYKMYMELECLTTIHMDPISTKDPFVAELKEKVTVLVKEVNEEITLHDFRIVRGDTHTNVLFDIVLPYEDKRSNEEVQGKIQSLVWEKIGQEYMTVIQVDRPFIG